MPRPPLALLPALCLLPLLLAPAADAAIADCQGDLTPSNPANPVVALDTSVGSICIELLEDQAPQTVANFLAYTGKLSLFHRALAGFVIQAGGFALDAAGEAIEDIPSLAPVQNEPCSLDELVPGTSDTMRCSVRGNVAGTLAMAKIGDPLCAGGNPDCVPRPDYVTTFLPRAEFVNSATNEWFINLVDNRANLDNQNGGFTVFARVLGDGMDLAQQIGNLPLLPSPYSSLRTVVGESDPISAFGNLPVQAIPLYPEVGVGCFDRDNAALLGDTEGVFLDDPVSRQPPFLVGAGCGTFLPTFEDYSPDPSQSEQCPTVDLPAGTFVQDPDGVPDLTMFFEFYQLTCDEVDESVEDARAAMMPLVTEQIVFVPEPATGLGAAAALAALALLAGARRPA